MRPYVPLVRFFFEFAAAKCGWARSWRDCWWVGDGWGSGTVVIATVVIATVVIATVVIAAVGIRTNS
jgi:hypothetical protein